MSDNRLTIRDRLEAVNQRNRFLIELYLGCTSHKDRACMLIVSATINMPQTLMYKGLEACHVNRLIVFAYL